MARFFFISFSLTMQINLSTNISDIKQIKKSQPPVFKSKFDKFAGMLRYDTVITKNERLAKKRALYDNIVQDLGKIEPNTIEKIASRYPDTPKNVIFALMNRLTTFSNIQSFVTLRNEFNKIGISDFYRFDPDYTTVNKNYSYKIKNPAGGKETTINNQILKLANSKLLNLNFVLSYFYSRYETFSAKCPLKKSINSALILDERSLNQLGELKEKDPTLFNKMKQSPRLKFVYIKNLENTYNIFEQHVDFEELLQKNLKKYNYLKKYYPNKTCEELLNLMFDSKSLKRIEKLGLLPIQIDISKPDNIDPISIATNMNPIIPDYKEYEDTLDDCMDMITYNPLNQNKVLEVLNERFIVYSPKSIAKKLQTLKTKIEESVKESGKDLSKIYYLVPKNQKSFALINYMYQKINDIPQERYIYWDNTNFAIFDHRLEEAYKDLEKQLPENSTVVILDDIIVSGDSMLSSQFKYLPQREKNSFDFIFAALYSTDRAKLLLDRKKNEEAKFYNNDKIISVDNQNIKLSETFPNKIELLKKNTHIMLPYNAPDNNCQHFKSLVELFYPKDENFVQETWEVFL